ncbi:C-X-C motif chemokine 9-like [Polyodon spathula]|uniref:C-X-C motif chemokine 9-like n=1 Tax=Polyodon spathula TaxID=7913 RepID=UPI001B7EC303|nr:C-X-C motif chemokine 9-like [Polyodon spathula]
MDSTFQKLSLVLALLTCTHLFKAQLGEAVYVPTRCQCLQNRKSVREPIVGFTITEKGTHCKNDEIILTLRETGRQQCLSPDGRQGKRLIKCWNDRINKDENKKNKCIVRRHKQKQQKKSSKAKTPQNPKSETL